MLTFKNKTLNNHLFLCLKNSSKPSGQARGMNACEVFINQKVSVGGIISGVG